MGTNRTPNEVRGFIVPWQMDKSNYWAAESSITQGKQRAGIPDPTNPTSLALGTKGQQTEDVQVFTLEGGHVGEGAKYGWKYSADPLIYGCQQPNVLMNVTAIAKLNLTGQQYIVRDAITLRDGTALVSVEYTTVTNNNVRVYQIDPDGTVSMHSINTVLISTLGGNKRYPCLVELANGYVLCTFWAIDSTNSTANMVVYQSTDNGSNWDLISRRALVSNLTGYTTLGRIKAAATESQILMFCDTTINTGSVQNIGYQFASVSQGTKFDYVGQSDPTNTTYIVYLPDVVQFNGTFILSWIRNDDTIGVTNTTDAYDNIFNALTFANVTEITGVDYASSLATVLVNGHKSMHIDVDGRIYIYAYLRVNEVLGVAYSDCAGIAATEYGKTWNFMGPNPAVVTPEMQHAQALKTGNVGGVMNIATTHYNGQQLVFCNWDANGTNVWKYSVMALAFGSWATQTNPPLVAYPLDHQWAHNTGDWVPSDLPTQGSTWLLTTTFTPTLTLDADRLDATCTIGEVFQYRKTIANKTAGATMHVVIDQVTNGNGNDGTYFGIQIQPTTVGTTNYYVRVYLTATGLYLFDMYGGLMDSVTGLATGKRALYLHVNNASGDCKLWYSDPDKPRQYSQLVGRAVTGASTTQQYEWGATTTSTGTTSSWAYVSYSEYSEMGIGIQTTTPGKQYPAVGYYSGLFDGMYITTADGPARETDQWDITPQYDTPIERVLYPLYPSRNIEWRSDAVANPDTTNVPTANIAWAIDPNDLGQTITPRNSVVGIHLNGINFRQMQMYIHNGTTWVLHSTAQNQVGSEFDFSRNGNTITVTSANTDRPFLHYNECSGWYLELEDEDENRYMRKIRINSEGILDFNATTQGVVFTLEDAKPTDPTVGIARIVPDACTVLLHNVISTSGFKIVLPAQKTQQGYFKIGHMVMGPVVIPATQYGRGRTISWEASTDVTTAPNGVQYANVRGRGGRTVRIGWVDGVDISELYQYTPNPDYYTTRPGGSPEATIGSAPTTMYGIVQQIQGEKNAIVYLPVIDTTSSANYDVINRYHDHVMVTLGNDVQIENVIGDESKNEVLRVGTVVMREVR